MNTIPPGVTPAKRRVRRKRTRVASPLPPPVRLELVAGAWDVGPLLLTFDRAIDIANILPAAFFVHDGITGLHYEGLSVIDQPSPASVMLELGAVGEYEGAEVLLTVSGNNGIVAVNDGGAFSGFNDVVLPYP
jgi:hypothetical protein